MLEAAGKDRARKRLVALMQSMHDPALDAAGALAAAAPPAAGGKRRILVQMQRAPLGFVPRGGSDGVLGGARLVRTELHGEPSPSQGAAFVDGSEHVLPCELALRSVGYRSLPIDGAPFDDKRGVVPSDRGRVHGCSDLYVSGWLKRGPNGVVLTNVNDAVETAGVLLRDRAEGKLDGGGDGAAAVRPLLEAQGVPVVDFAAWGRVDAEEVRRGALVSKAREKLVTEAEMLRVALG